MSNLVVNLEDVNKAYATLINQGEIGGEGQENNVTSLAYRALGISSGDANEDKNLLALMSKLKDQSESLKKDGKTEVVKRITGIAQALATQKNYEFQSEEDQSSFQEIKSYFGIHDSKENSKGIEVQTPSSETRPYEETKTSAVGKIWKFEKATSSLMGGMLFTYKLQVDGKLSDLKGVLQRLEKFDAHNTDLFPAVEPDPMKVVGSMPRSGVHTEFQDSLKRQGLAFDVLKTVRNAPKNPSKFPFGPIKDMIIWQLVESSKIKSEIQNCQTWKEIEDVLTNKFDGFVEEIKNQEGHSSNENIFKMLGYSWDYNKELNDFTITLPNKEAFDAGWKKCQEEIKNLPDFSLAELLDDEDDEGFIDKCKNHDASLSLRSETLHDQFAHVLAAVTSITENPKGFNNARGELKGKIDLCLSHLNYAKEHVEALTDEERKNLPILVTLLSAYVDSSLAQYSVTDLMDLLWISGKNCEGIAKVILEDIQWLRFFENKYPNMDKEQIMTLWSKVMSLDISERK